MRSRKALLLAPIATLLLALAPGCSVNTPDPPGGPVSFSTQIQPIFDSKCTTCHSKGGLGPGIGIAMLLTADATPADLINQPSSLNKDLTLVIPGDAANSLLYRMVSEPTPPVGIRMPPVSAPLSGKNLGLLRDWINQGAQDN